MAAQARVQERGARATRNGGASTSHAAVVPRPERSHAAALERAQHSEQLLEIQRSRLIAGAVCAIDELGYARATVGQITRRASVSRRTFYELFADREQCLAAVLEDVIGTIAGELHAAGLGGLEWRERVRAGLAAILAFLDREPALARVCVVQALSGGPRVLERREEVLAGLAAIIDEGRSAGSRGAECTALNAEGLVGAAFGIVYARLLKGDNEPLVGLLGELMGMIVLPYLGPAVARRELARPLPAVARASLDALPGVPRMSESPLSDLRIRLTYRTARVLEGIAGHPGASNREAGACAGVADPGQISKLLARLERAGLLLNTGEGHAKGEPNAWRLTERGERVVLSISTQPGYTRRAA